jgi:DNA-binding transcriptional LysR family regulator
LLRLERGDLVSKRTCLNKREDACNLTSPTFGQRLLDAPGKVAVLPLYFVREDLKARRLVRLLPKKRLRSDAFRLIWRTNHPHASDLLALAEELRAQPLR